ncbi:MAG: hypothetical protein MJ252_24860, partial [archaeon]|nr:hypothetical protein [archaeon]
PQSPIHIDAYYKYILIQYILILNIFFIFLFKVLILSICQPQLQQQKKKRIFLLINIPFMKLKVE